MKKIYAEIVDDETLEQFNEAMELECNVQGSLMPDAHLGYTLPIGAVVKSYKKIFPSYVGYDIGCGMCAVKLELKKEDVDLNALKRKIPRIIPLGFNRHRRAQDYDVLPLTDESRKFYEKSGRFQLGTLGGGNHFIELGEGEDKNLWIVIHSGSRGFGKKVAEYYMKLAAFVNANLSEYEKEFEEKNEEFKKHNPQRFEVAKKEYALKKAEKNSKNLEAHNGFDLDSKEGRDYIQDMESALQFALDNRKAMIRKILHVLGNPKELMFINRNHNHAEIDGDFVIHRKGATHANKGMLGVIPGNMKDGSFIVRGKGNAESLNSSSHGAGRVLSRSQAFKTLDMDEFNDLMEGIVSNHSRRTLDESPKAYKNIYEVMELQKDLVEVIDHVRTVLNVKG